MKRSLILQRERERESRMKKQMITMGIKEEENKILWALKR
jgi:hypothetical protein